MKASLMYSSENQRKYIPRPFINFRGQLKFYLLLSVVVHQKCIHVLYSLQLKKKKIVTVESLIEKHFIIILTLQFL